MFPPLPAFLSFSLLLLTRLASAQQNSGFSFPTGRFDPSSLILNPQANVSSSGDLVLDGSSSFSESLYGRPFSLAGLSFNTYFSISANSTSANGSFAFVIVASSTPDDSYETQSNAFAVVFNNTCLGNNGYDGSYMGRGNRGRGRGFFGPSMMTPSVYAGGQLLNQPNYLSTPYPWQNGPGWNGPNPLAWPASCSPQPDDDQQFEYEVAVQYNASAKEVTLALGSGCFVAGQVVFSQDLSTILANSAYVGFVASDGAVYTLTQWNFTTNATSSILSSIAASITTSSNSGTPSSGSSKVKKGYVVGFSVLGGGIGVATLVGACFLYRKRKAMTKTRVHGAEGAKFDSTPSTKAMMNTKLKAANEYDTSPLYPIQTRTSSAENASWLKPVAPR